MDSINAKNKYRFDDRRCFDLGPPKGMPERRKVNRREDDRFRAWLQLVFASQIEVEVTSDKIEKVIAPIIARIKTGEFG